MAYVYTKDLTDAFNMREVSYKVHNHFKKYHLLKKCINNFSIGKITSQMEYKPEMMPKKRGKVDTVWKAVKEYNDILEKIDDTNKKIAYLKRKEFTENEKIIFKYSIMDNELDDVVQDIVGLSEKTYKQVKKSCYIKVAIKFNLVQNMEKSIFKIMELLDLSS